MRKYKRKLTRKNAIKVYCKELCCAGDLKGWKECAFSACPLFPFRLGRETIKERQIIQKNTQNTIAFQQKTPLRGRVVVQNG